MNSTEQNTEYRICIFYGLIFNKMQWSTYSPKLGIKIVIENITLHFICNGYRCLFLDPWGDVSRRTELVCMKYSNFYHKKCLFNSLYLLSVVAVKELLSMLNVDSLFWSKAAMKPHVNKDNFNLNLSFILSLQRYYFLSQFKWKMGSNWKNTIVNAFYC